MTTATPDTTAPVAGAEKSRKRSTALQRTISLARAEWLQFRRNKTLLFMATVFPIGIPLLLFLVGDSDGEAVQAIQAANSFDMFVFYTLTFVQYYTVLSMATTRRDERVLKRLRTGEARDVEILAGIFAPGALLAVAFSVVIVPLLIVLGAPVPVNLLLIVVAVLLGLVLFSALALVTSAYTKNAEAAQITSFPVLTLAIIGLGVFRPVLGDGIVHDIVTFTPYAAISDLIGLGWNGATFTDLISGGAAVGFDETFTAAAQPLLILLVWTVLALFAAKSTMRWDSHR